MDDIIISILSYGIGSFVVTALFVRLGRQCVLQDTIRRHFYWFPLMPPVLLAWVIKQGITWTLSTVARLARRCFEILSGKRTYRRHKIWPYYHE